MEGVGRSGVGAEGHDCGDRSLTEGLEDVQVDNVIPFDETFVNDDAEALDASVREQESVCQRSPSVDFRVVKKSIKSMQSIRTEHGSGRLLRLDSIESVPGLEIDDEFVVGDGSSPVALMARETERKGKLVQVYKPTKGTGRGGLPIIQDVETEVQVPFDLTVQAGDEETVKKEMSDFVCQATGKDDSRGMVENLETLHLDVDADYHNNDSNRLIDVEDIESSIDIPFDKKYRAPEKSLVVNAVREDLSAYENENLKFRAKLSDTSEEEVINLEQIDVLGSTNDEPDVQVIAKAKSAKRIFMTQNEEKDHGCFVSNSLEEGLLDSHRDRMDVGQATSGNAHDGNERDRTGENGKKKRWLRLARTRSKDSPPPVEITFQVMQNRKVMRKINGTYESDRPWTMVWVFLTLLLIFGVAGASFVNGNFSLKFNTGQLGFWSLVTVLSFSILFYTLTRVMIVIRYMLYGLLVAEVLNLLINKEYNLFGEKTPTWLIVLLSVFEFVTLMVHIWVHYIYPKVLATDWFRETIGAQRWWEVRMIGPWTLTYSTGFGRATCSYRGQTNASGLPHGYGHWMDDSYHGEILTGWWENGRPVGPFRSREFGSGYAFDKVMIGFVMATDDEFETRNYIPKNTRHPRVGVASVECSVSGAFFSHLPEANILYGPRDLSNEPPSNLTVTSTAPLVHDVNEANAGSTATIGDCLARIRYLSIAHPLTSVLITAKRGRGVTVAGHICNATGKSSSENCERLVIDVVYPSQCKGTEDIDSLSGGTPTGATTGARVSSLASTAFYSDDDCSFEDENSHPGTHPSDTQISEHSQHTPSIRSSMQFAEFTSALPRNVSQDDLDDMGDHQDRESDVDSVEYDSTGFGLDSFSLNNYGRAESHAARIGTAERATSPRPEPEGIRANFSYTSLGSRHEEKEKILLQNCATESKGPIPYGFDSSTGHFQPVLTSSSAEPHLRVKDWRSTIDGHQEALIFIPGFNASLKHSLERLGQFLAIGHFPSHIKPFVFCWPSARIITYLKAMEMGAHFRTAEIFGEMLDGLYAAGIRDVHILTHSMGAQTLMGAFVDKDTGARSDVSMRFSLAADFVDTEGEAASVHTEYRNQTKLRARTITLLNPDLPLASFVDHGFATLRRVCNHVTVVGNRKDQALYWSEMGNGFLQTVYHYLGGSIYPEHLLVVDTGPGACECSSPKDADSCCPAYCTFCFQSSPEGFEKHQGRDRLWSKQLTVGKEIFSLFAPQEHRQRNDHNSSIFMAAPNAILDRMRRGRSRRRRKRAPRRPWLDLDAIDTTWMEANVHSLRHNYFNLNPILVEDLQELIVTGRRASERSTLLHREGNIYSYCQAPACVVNDT
mmetsp:Transcript_45198/g.72461  ORF Transcript_45198/g.72461 Transcript_45198/m.72461 type:complete len:1349 (-) Transcript_45198:1079-5125(-)